jgi:multisubunit Na+/H+ antiporter MnhC subunit
MPLESVLIVAAIVTAFVTFGIVLAWAERQTQGISKHQ